MNLTVYDCLIQNLPSLNPDKSEAAIFGTQQKVQLLSKKLTLSVADTPITASESIKSLGVTLDKNMTYNKHISSVQKVYYFHIRALWHIRSSISIETAKMLSCAIVSNQLVYCNALLTSMSETNFNKLQMVQNMLARVVIRADRRNYITPVLTHLH